MSGLYDDTGMTGLDWCRRIQALIDKHSSDTDDPNHRWTSSPDWIAELTDELWEHLEHDAPVDENMWMASHLGEILCCWFSAVKRAKCLDPNRPVTTRKRADGQYMEWLLDLTASIHQTRMLPELFPGQEWESPFIANATNGTFV